MDTLLIYCSIKYKNYNFTTQFNDKPATEVNKTLLSWVLS